jgi:hypothetical protein
MAYPIIAAPYGYRPINLIGGQVFSGSTRNYPIAYNYNQNIFYGDPVTISSGFVVVATAPMSTTNTTVGIFLGCSFTNPITKQKQFQQYYPLNTAAGDIEAIVCDDPDTVFRMAVVTLVGATTIGSMSQLAVGVNVAGSTVTTGNISTGNSTLGVVGVTANQAGGGWRVLGLVPDTQIDTGCTYVSGSGSSSIVVSGLTIGQVIPIGTDMYQQQTNGQLQWVGAVNSAVTVSSTTSQTLTMSTTTTITGTALTLVQSPEIFAKINFSAHRYYVA